MGSDGDKKATNFRETGVRFVVSALVTMAVYLDFLGGSVQSFPDVVPVVIAIGAGVMWVVLSQYAGPRLNIQEYIENNVLFLLAMVTGIVLLLALFPGGIPESAAVGFILFVWVAFISRLTLTYIA